MADINNNEGPNTAENSKSTLNDVLFARAFKLMASSTVLATVWGRYDELKGADQAEWGDIIVKHTCKVALEMASLELGK